MPLDALALLTVNSTTESITIVDVSDDGHPLVFANKGFEKVTGYSFDETVGRNCRFLQGKDTSPDAKRTIRNAIQDFKPCQVEILNYRKNGEPFWNQLNLSPMEDQENRKYMVGIQIDATRRKLAETKLETYTAKLERIIKSKDDLISIITHDFRGSVGDISLMTEVLTEKIDATKKGLQSIQASSRLMLTEFQDLVELHSSELGGKSQIVDLSLEKIVKRILTSQENYLERKKISFKINIDTETNILTSLDLVAVLRNIISNSIKFVGENGLITATHEKDKDSHIIEITDNGIGMPKETANALYRRDILSVSNLGVLGEVGSGLGSLIVSRLATKNNWVVDVKSAEGEGTQVTVKIPDRYIPGSTNSNPIAP